MQENKFTEKYWLKYNAFLLKKRKYHVLNIFSFVKLIVLFCQKFKTASTWTSP